MRDVTVSGREKEDIRNTEENEPQEDKDGQHDECA